MKHNRRNFIGKISLATAGITGLSSFKNEPGQREVKNVFIHHVFFWLKNPESAADRDKLVEGLLNLSKMKTIKNFHIGKPAATNRDVIERGYAVSWLLYFKNEEAEASYQSDPLHLKFIEDYSHLWSKVIVYDSVDI